MCIAMFVFFVLNVIKGKDATSVFDSMHHSDEALAMMNNYYIGDFHPNLNQPTVSVRFKISSYL